MKTSKYFLLVAALVLLVGLVGTAMAQGKMDSKGSADRLPPEPIQPIVSVSAIEVTDGMVGVDSTTGKETAFGYSFLGQTTGSLPGSFTMAMNCAPALPIPGSTSEVSGGSWTLPVYMTSIKGGPYAGSLYGTIAKGTMSWDKTGTNATVYIVLDVKGTQTWEGAGGYASFAGNLYVDEKSQETRLDGTMVFTLINPIP